MTVANGRRHFLATLGAAGAALLLPRAGWAAPLEKVKEAGTLRVGLYANNRPWSWDDAGVVRGIDADIARAVAEELGVKTDLALFTADEDVSDDLRNVVWRGGLLGFRPCDIMMHVPFDRKFMADQDQVLVLAPYYREAFGAICAADSGRDCEAVPTVFRGRRVAAELDSIPDFYLLGSFGGVLRPDLEHYPTGFDAAAAVQSGKADFAVATRAQIDAAIAAEPEGGAKRRQGPLPAMLSPGWDIGIAVKENSRSLGFAIEDAMGKIAEDGRLAAIFARYGTEWKAADAATPHK